MPLLLLWHPQGTAGPAPEPEVALEPRYTPPNVGLYSAGNAEHIMDIRSIAFAQVAWNENGPDTATLGVSRSSPALPATVLFPSGIPSYVKIKPATLVDIDGVEFDIDVWAGRLVRPQGNATAPVWQVQCEGPASWISEFALPSSWPKSLPAARLADWTTRVYPEMRVKMGTIQHRGATVPTDTRGQDVYGLWSSMATDRGETFWLSADPDEIMFYLDWSHPLGARDRTGEIQLEADTPGANVTWDPSYELWRPAEATIIAGWSAAYGSTIMARGIRRAPGNVYGRSGALSATLNSPIARSLGGLPTTFRPDMATTRAIQVATAARMRASMVPSTLVRVTVTKIRSSLFSLRPGDLVRCRWRDEPTGLFADGIGQVQAKTVQLAPTLACEYALEVWGE